LDSSSKVDLIKQVFERLHLEENGASAAMVLTVHGVDTSGIDKKEFWNSLMEVLAKASDLAIVKLAQYYELPTSDAIDETEVGEEAINATTIGTDRAIELFVSHYTRDVTKRWLEEIKKALEPMCVNAFVAHFDIKPSKRWQEEILKRLNRCDALLVLFTKNCSLSEWVDQEVGIGIGKGKPIFPLSNERVPYGFVGEIQSFNYFNVPIEKVTESIVVMLVNDNGIGKDYCNILAKVLKMTSDREKASNIVSALENCENVLPNSVITILKDCIELNSIIIEDKDSVNRIMSLINRNVV